MRMDDDSVETKSKGVVQEFGIKIFSLRLMIRGILNGKYMVENTKQEKEASVTSSPKSRKLFLLVNR